MTANDWVIPGANARAVFSRQVVVAGRRTTLKASNVPVVVYPSGMRPQVDALGASYSRAVLFSDRVRYDGQTEGPAINDYIETPALNRGAQVQLHDVQPLGGGLVIGYINPVQQAGAGA